jgi:acetyltransferase-like isoleucine patch superfamily enzyme
VTRAPYIHPTAEVDPGATIGDGTSIWNWAKVREDASIGDDCTIGQGAYIDRGVTVGRACKIQNYALVYAGVTLGDEVFVGPHATFTNDHWPRAVGSWEIVPTIVEDGASIGANATVVCGVRLGRSCMVGAGSVVVHDVPPRTLVVGNPARVVAELGDDGRPRR